MFSMFDRLKSIFFYSNSNKRKPSESIETLSRSINDQNDKENTLDNKGTVYNHIFNDYEGNIKIKIVDIDKQEMISATKRPCKNYFKEKYEAQKIVQSFNTKSMGFPSVNKVMTNGNITGTAIKKNTSSHVDSLNYNFNTKSHLLDRNLIEKLKRPSIHSESRQNQLKILNIESVVNDSEVKKLESNYLQDISDRFRELWTSQPTVFPRLVKKPVLPKITNDMKVLVLSTLSSSMKDVVVVEDFSLAVTGTDIYSLQPRQWLTDNIINFYLELINARNNSGKSYPKIQIMTTFFYPKLASAGYNGVRRWTKRRPLFDSQLVLVPIHLGNHWCLVTIDIDNEEVLYYDSLKSPAPRILNDIKNFLIEDYKDKLNKQLHTADWIFQQKYDGPSQTNGYDCGVFLCQTAEYASRRAKLDFKQDQMEYFREKMSYEIMTRSLL